MTENRNKVTVKNFLKSLPENYKIQCVTMDMWQPYKDAVLDILGDVPVVIDKFHVIRELNRALEEIRRMFQKDMEKESCVSLKNMQFLFLTGGEKLTPRQSKQLDLLIETYPQFKTTYYLKRSVPQHLSIR